MYRSCACLRRYRMYLRSPSDHGYIKNELKRQGTGGGSRGCKNRSPRPLCLGPDYDRLPDATFYSMVQPGDIPEIVSEHLLKGRRSNRLLYQETVSPTGGIKALSDTDFYKKQHRIALRSFAVFIDPENIEEYIGNWRLSGSGKGSYGNGPGGEIQTL